MPFSNCEQITPIATEIRRFRPNSVLDVGCGVGLYGMLCRVFLDLYDDESFMLKLQDPLGKNWQVRIDGIEGTPDYLPFIPGWVYDDVYCGNALDRLAELEDGTYDLVLALAIIEHFDRDQGIEFLNHLKRVGRRVILSVPKKVMPQSVPGCPYETHRSEWSQQDFIDCGFTRFLPHFGAWIAIYDPDADSSQTVSEPVIENQSGGELSNTDMHDHFTRIHQTLLSIQAQQVITNQRLSIRFRLHHTLDKVRARLRHFRAS